MSLTNYTDLQAEVATYLQRSDLTAVIPDFIAIFEAAANRKLRVRQMEASSALVPSTVATITGAANSGAGLIRLTVNSTTGFATGNIDTVANVVGTTEANTSWPIIVVNSTTIDLSGSTFTNAYVSGGTITDAGSVPLPSDYLAWRQVKWLGNPLRSLEYAEPAWITAAYPSGPTNLPSNFTIEGSTLRIMPVDPTTILLQYWQKIPALASNATNWLMTAHPDIYLFGSLVEANAYTIDPDKAMLWKARRDELFDEIDKLDKKSRGPSRVRVMSPTP